MERAMELSCRYDDNDTALNTGMILKEMLRYEPLARILLYSEQ
jgi:calcium binding protein 39